MDMRLLTALLLPILACACASKPPEPKKFSVGGFSMSVPPKDGWGLVQQTKDRIMLAKPGDFAGETLSIQLVERQLPAGATGDGLVRHVKDAERQILDPKRFRVNRHDVTPQAMGTLNCALSDLEVEDRGAATANSPVASLVVQTLTVTCPSSSRRGQGVSLAYIHSSYPEDRKAAFVEQAKPVLSSLTEDP